MLFYMYLHCRTQCGIKTAHFKRENVDQVPKMKYLWATLFGSSSIKIDASQPLQIKHNPSARVHILIGGETESMSKHVIWVTSHFNYYYLIALSGTLKKQTNFVCVYALQYNVAFSRMINLPCSLTVLFLLFAVQDRVVWVQVPLSSYTHSPR